MSSIQDRINALKKSQGGGKDDKAQGPPKTSAARPAGSAASKFGGGSPKCYICDKSVFKVEELKALDRVYHKSCFRCSGKVKNGCEKVLSLTDYVDRKTDDGTKEPYCRSCYNKLYAPKGMNKAAGNTMDTTVNKPKANDDAAPPAAPVAENTKAETKPIGAGPERRASIQDRLAALKASQGGSSSVVKPPVVKSSVASIAASKFGHNIDSASYKRAEVKTETKPPKDEPPKQEPPKEEPPKEQPPKEEPPKEQPPKEQPPKQEPPKQESSGDSEKIDSSTRESVDGDGARPSITKRVSTGLAARLGGLDLSKVGMTGASPRVTRSSVTDSGELKCVSNVATNDDGKVEVDNAMAKATVRKGGRKAPTRKAFKPDED